MVKSGRIVPLEGLRAIAASVIVVQHVLLAFSPATSGLLAQDRVDSSLVGSPIFVIMNGPAAITFFFVLSGFVLCRGFFEDGDTDRLARGFVKRLPRLAGLVILTTLGSCLLFSSGAYHFSEAARISGSGWLADFGYSGWTAEFRPDYSAALFEGIATFFSRTYVYNGVLWTMNHAFVGSLFVSTLAAFLLLSLRQRQVWLVGGLTLLASLLYVYFLFPFVVGAFLAFRIAHRPPRLPLAAALGLLVPALYLLGYLVPQGSYLWAASLPPKVQPYVTPLSHSLGSALVIMAVLGNRRLFSGLDRPVWRELGRLSFPLYLVHPLVIFSASCALFLDMSAQGYGQGAILAAMFIVTFVASLVVAVPLGWLDGLWVWLLDRAVRRLLPSLPVAAPPTPVAEEPPLRQRAEAKVIDLRPPPLARPQPPSIPPAWSARGASGIRDGG